jgi:hypothetical protein
MLFVQLVPVLAAFVDKVIPVWPDFVLASSPEGIVLVVVQDPVKIKY